MSKSQSSICPKKPRPFLKGRAPRNLQQPAVCKQLQPVTRNLQTAKKIITVKHNFTDPWSPKKGDGPRIKRRNQVAVLASRVTKKSDRKNKSRKKKFLKQKITGKTNFPGCLISITRTKNNTHASLSSLFGESKTKYSTSGGQFKLKGGRRKTRLSQRLVYQSCLNKALSFGYKYAVIHCKGIWGFKTKIFRFFEKALLVILIKDTTGTTHNGCRPPKKRRL